MAGQAINPANIPGLFRKQFELCKVRKGETVILLSDFNTRRDYVQACFAAAGDLGAHAYEIGVSRSPDWSHIGVDVVGEAKGMKDALVQGDLIVAFHPPNFSNWQKQVRAAGGRVLSIADSPDVLARLISPPGLKEAVLHAAERWGNAGEIQLLSDAGTDLRWRRGEFKVKSQADLTEKVKEQMESSGQELPVTLEKVDMEWSSEGKGELLWNVKEGHFVSFEMDAETTLKSVEEMSIDAGGRQMSLTQTRNMSGSTAFVAKAK